MAMVDLINDVRVVFINHPSKIKYALAYELERRSVVIQSVIPE